MKVDSKANYTQEVTAHRCSWLRTQDAELSPAERKRFQPLSQNIELAGTEKQ